MSAQHGLTCDIYNIKISVFKIIMPRPYNNMAMRTFSHGGIHIASHIIFSASYVNHYNVLARMKMASYEQYWYVTISSWHESLWRTHQIVDVST